MVGPDDPSTTHSNEFIALTIFNERIRAVSLSPDGAYLSFIDPSEHEHQLIHILDAESLRLADAVEEFEDLINHPRVRESDMQLFLERHPDFILSEEYRRAHCRIVLESSGGAGARLIPDFVIEPLDPFGLADLLELKHPTANVIVLKQSRRRYSASVREACAQLLEYSQFFEEKRNRDAVADRYGLVAFRPRLFVVIGRRPPVSRIELRGLDDLPSRVVLHTYDDLLARVSARRQKIYGELQRRLSDPGFDVFNGAYRRVERSPGRRSQKINAGAPRQGDHLRPRVVTVRTSRAAGFQHPKSGISANVGERTRHWLLFSSPTTTLIRVRWSLNTCTSTALASIKRLTVIRRLS